MEKYLEDKKNYILCYTRNPQEDDIYSGKLAYSMHLAVCTDEETGKFVPLNHNSGVLFAKAIQKQDGTLDAKSLKNPWIFACPDGGYGVVAQRTEPDGSGDDTSAGKILFFQTEDFLQYEERTMVSLKTDKMISRVMCHFDEESQEYIIRWNDEEGNLYENRTEEIENQDKMSLPYCVSEVQTSMFLEAFEVDKTGTEIEGAVFGNVLEIPGEMAKRLKNKLLVHENIEIRVPKRVKAASKEELNQIRAEALYSDGISEWKRIDWYTDNINWDTEGVHNIFGRVHQNHYEFPIAFNRADPCIGKWKGKYYFIATNDADHEHSIYIREADTIPELVTAQEVKILDASMYPHLGNLLWAPEFHIIKDKLYIFHAGTPGDFMDEQCHVMALKEGGNPTIASDWEIPRRVVKKDGNFLSTTNTITLDMTCFEVKGHYYVVWSQRQFKPVDQGAWLYIAEVDADQPWRLITEPVLISMPEYGWANNHTFVDEGPFALITEKKIFLTFSSAAVDSTYVVGLLTAEPDADLLNPKSWVKTNYPLLTSRSVPGQYGTGHNAYIIDEYGDVWNTYHARPGVNGARSSGIRRVHYDIDGYPMLDITEEKDLNPELAEVSVELEVIKRKRF